ncbi:MAG: DUF1501 domain-containing protein [Chthoniobacterales bacterium]
MNEPTSRSLHTRREFLRTTLLGGAFSLTVPFFLEQTFMTMDALAADSAIQTTTGKNGTILILLQLAGGNDGLNTVIPYADDAYYRARPKIGLKPNQCLKLNSYCGLNPRLVGLKSLYDQGHMGLIQGVGYPNPNRSHFRSTEIWATGSDANDAEAQGWIGRYFDNCCKGSDPSVGISISREVPQTFAANEPRGISFMQPEQFRYKKESASDPTSVDSFYRVLQQPGGDAGGVGSNEGGSIGAISGSAPADGSSLDYLRRTALDAQVSSDRILEISRKQKSLVDYPKSQLANNFNLIGRLIAGGMPTRVYYLSQGGYDTHSGQQGTHDRLMGDLDGALCAFVEDLKKQGNLGRVVIMTFSEFGRRMEENASGGTDHGAAAPLFVLGGGVHPGLYGRYPSLTQLQDGDLVFNTDFRSLYATLLEKWLNVPSDKVLKRKFPLMPFLT